LQGQFSERAVYAWLTAPSPTRMPEITWTVGRMDELLQRHPNRFNFVHLSNILDWLTPTEARNVLELAWMASRPGGRVLIRQLNSKLDIPALGGRWTWDHDQAQALHERDRSYFYRRLHLGRKP
jgi:S-adenosylmethionine-diacylglycerol 3-amino-3-carboxypropyl transferase